MTSWAVCSFVLDVAIHGNPTLHEANLRKKYVFVEKQLAKGPYLFGEQFTVADAYLFTVTNWANFVKLDLSDFPNTLAFQKRVASRPAVQTTLVAEGLAKAK